MNWQLYFSGRLFSPYLLQNCYRMQLEPVLQLRMHSLFMCLWWMGIMDLKHSEEDGIVSLIHPLWWLYWKGPLTVFIARRPHNGTTRDLLLSYQTLRLTKTRGRIHNYSLFWASIPRAFISVKMSLLVAEVFPISFVSSLTWLLKPSHIYEWPRPLIEQPKRIVRCFAALPRHSIRRRSPLNIEPICLGYLSGLWLPITQE